MNKVDRINMSKQNRPSDLSSLNNIDLIKWNNSYAFPLTWLNIIEIEDKVKQVLNNHIKLNNQYSNIILISYKIFIEYSNFISSLIITKNRNSFSVENQYLYAICTKGIPDKPIVSFPELVNNVTRFRKKYRYLKKLVFDNGFNLLNPFTKKHLVLTESRSHHTIEFLKKTRRGIIIPFSFYDVYKKENLEELSIKDKNEILKLSSLMISDLKKIILNDYQIALSEKQIGYLESVTFDVFSKSFITLSAVKKRLSNRKLKLFLGSNNSFLSRILSVAIRDNKGEIHGFSHGEPLVYDWDKISWMELSLNNFYYEYTNPLVKELKNIYKSRFDFNNRVKIKSFNSDLFKKYYEDNKKQEVNNYPQKVMLVGNAFKEIGVSSVTAPFGIMQLQIEVEIINRLINIGKEVLYKKHPGGYFSKKKLPFSNDENIKIVEEPFESSCTQADVLIFYYTRTTTFGHALASKKKIIIIDTGIEIIPDELLSVLKKQCFFIKAKLDSNNKFVLNEHDLLNAINEKPTKDIFYKTYLIN